MLLPLPRAAADELALQVHLALDALRRGSGGRTAARTLAQMAITARFLSQRGHGDLTGEELSAADAVIIACFDNGERSDVWALDDAGADTLADLVTRYDRLLHRVPFRAIAEASEYLDRAGDGRLALAARSAA